MRVNLVAVQARLDLDRYRSTGAFRGWMSRLVEESCAAGDKRLPSLLVFPEGLGLFLSLVPHYYDLMREARTVGSAVWRVGLRRWPGLLATALRYQAFGVRTPMLQYALETREAYYSTFADLARREGVYIVAGTGFFPDFDRPPLKAPRVADRSVYNVAPLFTPSGAVLGETKKVHRACRWERRFAFAEGSPGDLFPAQTAIGRVGVLVCHDSLRPNLLARMDALGTEVLAVPAYNIAPWYSTIRGTGLTQEDAWLDKGLGRLVEERENIRFAVCSMLVGSIFDLHSEGKSFIWESGAGGRPGGLAALASSYSEEEIVAAQCEIGATVSGFSELPASSFKAG